MNNQDFQNVLTRRIDLTRKVLERKAEEYSSDTDRLHNFKRGASMFNVTPEKHCEFLLSKHLISIFDMVSNLDKGITPGTAEWDEKIGDAVNYLILLEALTVERNHETFDREIQNRRSDV